MILKLAIVNGLAIEVLTLMAIFRVRRVVELVKKNTSLFHNLDRVYTWTLCWISFNEPSPYRDAGFLLMWIMITKIFLFKDPNSFSKWVYNLFDCIVCIVVLTYLVLV